MKTAFSLPYESLIADEPKKRGRPAASTTVTTLERDKRNGFDRHKQSLITTVADRAKTAAIRAPTMVRQSWSGDAPR